MPDDTFASFSARLTKLGKALSGPEMKPLMTRVGVNAKKIAESEASSDLGGDAKFSGWKAKLDTRFDHVGDGRISFHPTGRSAGPWTVAEKGRKGGAAVPKRKGKAVLNTPWGPRTYTKGSPMRLGATGGKHTASRVLDRIERETPPIIDRAVAKVVRDLFD